MNPQAEIDKLVKQYPQVLEYVDWIKYVPQGSIPPSDTTHTLKLASFSVGNDDEAMIAIKVKPLYTILLNALLKVL